VPAFTSLSNRSSGDKHLNSSRALRVFSASSRVVTDGLHWVSEVNAVRYARLVTDRNLNVGLLPYQAARVNHIAFLERATHRLVRDAMDCCSVGQGVDHDPVQPSQFLLPAFILGYRQSLSRKQFHGCIVRLTEQICKHRVAEVQAS